LLQRKNIYILEVDRQCPYGTNFSYSNQSIYTTLGEMTGVDKIMNPQHIGIDLADIRIRIRINQEIWIQILYHLWLRLGTV